jgi:EAL and modified HD-GYP domain-containing signal transduction protein
LHERYIARQPIFDFCKNLYGYELLFRDGPQNAYTKNKHATAALIADVAMLFDGS